MLLYKKNKKADIFDIIMDKDERIKNYPLYFKGLIYHKEKDVCDHCHDKHPALLEYQGKKYGFGCIRYIKGDVSPINAYMLEIAEDWLSNSNNMLNKNITSEFMYYFKNTMNIPDINSITEMEKEYYIYYKKDSRVIMTGDSCLKYLKAIEAYLKERLTQLGYITQWK